MSELVCLCHGNVVDPDTGKPCCVILKYSNNYDGYWTGEDVAIQLQDTYKTFINIHPGCLPLYVFDNSSNHHKISTDALYARKLNLINIHPGCLPMYVFDNSSNHHNISTDALYARKLNLKDVGGKPPLLCDWIIQPSFWCHIGVYSAV